MEREELRNFKDGLTTLTIAQMRDDEIRDLLMECSVILDDIFKIVKFKRK